MRRFGGKNVKISFSSSTVKMATRNRSSELGKTRARTTRTRTEEESPAGWFAGRKRKRRSGNESPDWLSPPPPAKKLAPSPKANNSICLTTFIIVISGLSMLIKPAATELANNNSQTVGSLQSHANNNPALLLTLRDRNEDYRTDGSPGEITRRRASRSPGPATNRPTGSGDSITRIVAVSGQWIELQCPLASELLAVANSGAPNAQPDHSIVWRKNGSRMAQLGPRQRVNAQNGSLTIVSGQPKLDEAAYECALVQTARENNDAESIKSHKFELKLIVPPRLAPFEFPQAAQVGMKVVLTCSALEGQQPISFIWLKDNQIIQSGSSQFGGEQPANSLGQLHQQQLADKLALSSGQALLYSAPSGREQHQKKPEYVVLGGSEFPDTSGPSTELLPLLSDSNVRIRQADDYSILSIERLELKHSGRYTCSAQNEGSRASHSSQLVINAPPSITIEPRDADLVSGQSSVIECAASGQPRPSISWLRGRESSNKVWDYLPVYDNLRYTSLQNGSLLISNVTQREQGYYLCSAKNGFGPEVTKLIKINVHEPAKFGAKYKTAEVRIEERVNMVCMATGEPPVTIEWLDRDGNLIQRNDKKFIIDSEPEETGNPPVENATLSRLILTKSLRLDSGHYTCLANNKYGSDKMVTNLLVQDVPDRVSELKVTNATATTVSLRWQLTFTGNSPITSYLVQYQSDDPLDDLMMSSQQQSLSQSGLSTPPPPPGNIADLELLGNQLNFLESLKQQHQANSATSSLKAALEALNLGGATEEAIDRTLVELTVEQSATNLLVKDLQPYCVYRLRLAAINKIGLGEFSDWIRFKTEEAPPSGSALKILAAATGPNSIKLTWSPPDRRSWNGQLLGFNIGYRPLDSSLEFNKTVEWTPPSLQSLMFPSDQPTSSEGNSKGFGIGSFKLQMDSLASSLATTNPPATSASKKVTEEKLRGNSTSVQEQRQHSKETESRYLLRQHLRQLVALQQQELVAHLTNLQRSTTYLVWMQAINNRGLGPQSHAVSVKTLDDVPPSAPSLKIQSTSPTSITIGWSLLSNFISPANQYSLFYRRLPPALPLYAVRQQQFNFTPAPIDGELNQLNPPEPGPFIERTLNSKLLMMNGQEEQSMLDAVNPDGIKPANYLNNHQLVYTLDQLECGSVYELYMTTRNSVGKSEPSSVLTTRTLGEPPQPPVNKNSLFSRIGSNEVALNLAAWSTGGCPLTYLSVRYKQAPLPAADSLAGSNSAQHNLSSPSLTISWPITTSVPTSVLASLNGSNRPTRPGTSDEPLQQAQKFAEPMYSLKNLAPGSCYELELVAYNAAGHTSAQYEFVTSSANGTRAGYTRKESVFRLDQRGLLLDSDQPRDYVDLLHASSTKSIHSGPHQQPGSWQLVPLASLCLICLLVSSTFCYCRLNQHWKNHNRRSSVDTTTTSGAGILSSLSRQPGSNSSPGSIGKSSAWRLNNQFNQNNSRAPMKDSELQLEDSPTTVHYCVREATGKSQEQFINSSKAFSQSVSMRDFNLGSPQTASATLNFKTFRQQQLAKESSLQRKQLVSGGTLRARLSGINPNFGNYAVSANQESTTPCDNNNEQETSWTTSYGATASGSCPGANCKHATTYAIPSAGTYGEHQPQNEFYNNQQGSYCQAESRQQDVYGQLAAAAAAAAGNANGNGNGNGNNIEACIQQLVNNQQQQQQQQQHARCIYSGNYNILFGQPGQQEQQVNLGPSGFKAAAAAATSCGQQSVIESSSGSSSGIDVGNHQDAASTTTGSNGSNGFPSFHLATLGNTNGTSDHFQAIGESLQYQS